MSWVKTYAKLVYGPHRPDLRKENRNVDWMLVGEVDWDVARLMRSWINARRWEPIQQPVWKPHVTIADGRSPIREEFRNAWKRREGRGIKIEYSLEFFQKWKFFCVPVRSDTILSICDELGLSRDYPFHITVGRLP